MDLEDKIYGATTLIECSFQNIKSQGTGFYFVDLEKPDENIEGNQWRRVLDTWIITNRHVALPKVNNQEIVPDVFSFNLRQSVNNKIEWLPIVLNGTELLSRMKVHSNSNIDVVAIKIDDIITNKMLENKNVMNPLTITSDQLPSNSQLTPEASDDIIVAGYPRGFYDYKNKFPIIKSGIIATKWLENFNGEPLFLIDCKLFPGSSGSIVLSKPCNIAFIDGELMSSKSKNFVLLGIYSGEPFLQEEPIELEDITIIKKQSFNVGNVWYSHLITDIIKNGISLQ